MFSSPVWNNESIQITKKIESVQKFATKIVPGCKDLSYAQRLEKLNLNSLSYRRTREDLIAMFKIINDSDFKKFCELKDNTKTRSSSLSITSERCYVKSRKNFLTRRIKKLWNSLAPKIEKIKNIKSLISHDLND